MYYIIWKLDILDPPWCFTHTLTMYSIVKCVMGLIHPFSIATKSHGDTDKDIMLSHRLVVNVYKDTATLKYSETNCLCPF